MSDRIRFPAMDDLPVCIEPLYSAESVNAPVVLAKGRMALIQDDAEHEAEGTVSYAWMPFAHTLFELEGVPPNLWRRGIPARLRLPDGAEAEIAARTGYSLSNAGTKRGAGVLRGRFADVTIRPNGETQRLLVHIANLRGLGSSGGLTVRNADGSRAWRGRYSFSWTDYRVTIDRLPEPQDRVLARTHGIAITHVALVDLEGGSSLDEDRFLDVLTCLQYLASFCSGAWSGPVISVGLDAADRRTWERWEGRPHVSPYVPCETWLPQREGAALDELAAGFWEHLSHDVWGEPTALGLYWYVHANLGKAGLEASIMLACAAFEMLAWTRLVEEREVLSAAGFEKLPAADRLRLLLASCDVGLAIPRELAALDGAARALDWEDGPQAVVEIRNAFVHPVAKKRKRLEDVELAARGEAYRLAIYYLELVLLHVLNYKGIYRDRFTGEELKVPWAS